MRILFRPLVVTAFVAGALLFAATTSQAQVRQMPNFSGVQPVSATVGFLQRSATIGAGRYLASPARFYGAYGGGGWGGGGWGGGGYGYGCYGCDYGYGYGPGGDITLGNTL